MSLAQCEACECSVGVLGQIGSDASGVGLGLGGVLGGYFLGQIGSVGLATA